MKGDLEWFKFRDSWIDVFTSLSKPEMDRLFFAIREFNNGRELPDMVGRESLVWIMIKAELEKDKTSRRNAAEAHKVAGAKGGRPKAAKTNLDITETKKTNLVSEKPNETKKTNLEQLRVKELRVKSTESEKNNICAEARNSSSPDDHEFWAFAKENADLAEAFYKATGISPVKSQFGRWVNDLRDLSEAGINIERMQKTVAYMNSENIPLSAPGSILKTAQWLKSRGSVPSKSRSGSAKQQPSYNAFEELAMHMNGIPEPSWDVEL